MKKRTASLFAVVFLLFFSTIAGASEPVVSNDGSGYISILTEVTFPSASSGDEIVSSILANVEFPTWEETGGGSDAAGIVYENKIKEQLNFVTFSSYKNVGDMPVTRAILGTGKFNLHFWPEVANSLEKYVSGGEFISASNIANDLSKSAIPRAEGVVEHAQDVIPGIVIPISISIMTLVFVIQTIATFLRQETKSHDFFVNIVRFMFFIVAIITFRAWASLIIDIFNFGGYLMAPWGGQEELQKAIVFAANETGGILDWLKPMNVVVGIMRWVSYMAIKVLLISRDVMLAVSLVTGPLCFAIGYLSLYTSEDVTKGFLAGWMQSFFKYQFWGVFAAIAMVGLCIVDFMTKAGAGGNLVVFITAIAFVHVAFNIPKLADNMSGVVISSVLMATFSMAASRAGGSTLSAGAGAAKAGAGRILRR